MHTQNPDDLPNVISELVIRCKEHDKAIIDMRCTINSVINDLSELNSTVTDINNQQTRLEQNAVRIRAVSPVVASGPSRHLLTPDASLWSSPSHANADIGMGMDPDPSLDENIASANTSQAVPDSEDSHQLFMPGSLSDMFASAAGQL